jgi:predicted nucleic acid-binding protein
MIALVDTSFVVALEVKSDRDRPRGIVQFEAAKLLYLPQSVLNETCYLLTKAGGNRASASFLERLPRSKYVVLPLEEIDLQRTAAILRKYEETRVDFVDATVAALAERLKVQIILTLDRRDFSLIRPGHVQHFEILP